MANSREFLIGMTIGGVIGGALGLLYAPKAGADTLQDLGERAGDLKSRASDVAERVRDTSARLGTAARDTAARGREVAGVQKAAVEAAVDAGKKAYLETSEELRGSNDDGEAEDK